MGLRRKWRRLSDAKKRNIANTVVAVLAVLVAAVMAASACVDDKALDSIATTIRASSTQRPDELPVMQGSSPFHYPAELYAERVRGVAPDTATATPRSERFLGQVTSSARDRFGLSAVGSPAVKPWPSDPGP